MDLADLPGERSVRTSAMTFAARPEERLFERPLPPGLSARARFALIVAVCFLLHAIPVAFLLNRDRPDDLAPGEQEIPVEIVVEPPPKAPDPPPPAPKQEKQPPQATLDEKIATDAPRPPNEEKNPKDAKDEATHGPKTAPENQPASSPPASEAAPVPQKAVAQRPDEAAAPQPMDVRDDGDPLKTAERQKPDPQDPMKALQEALQPRSQSAPKQAATVFAALPDYSFAPPSRHASTAVGKAASTYLSIVYGMVMAHGRLPEAVAAHVTTTGDIIFNVDASGRLVGARIVKSCGAPEVDAAEKAAIRAAAPFPPPPTGTGLNLTLHYGR